MKRGLIKAGITETKGTTERVTDTEEGGGEGLAGDRRQVKTETRKTEDNDGGWSRRRMSE